jgi:hypothetical protein
MEMDPVGNQLVNIYFFKNFILIQKFYINTKDNKNYLYY